MKERIPEGWYSVSYNGYTEFALYMGGRLRLVNLDPEVSLPLTEVPLESRVPDDQVIEEIEGRGIQGQWYCDWRTLIEHVQRSQEEKLELEDARCALRKVAKLNHKLQNIFVDEGLMYGETLGLLCDYILAVDRWHPEPKEGKQDG